MSSQEFAENEVSLLLALLAYNLASLLRIELEDELGGCWDLRRFQQTVLRAGGRVVKHSRRLLLYVEQSVDHVWQLIVRRIRRLRLPPRWQRPRGPHCRTWIPPPAHAHLAVVLRTGRYFLSIGQFLGASGPYAPVARLPLLKNVISDRRREPVVFVDNAGLALGRCPTQSVHIVHVARPKADGIDVRRSAPDFTRSHYFVEFFLQFPRRTERSADDT